MTNPVQSYKSRAFFENLGLILQKICLLGYKKHYFFVQKVGLKNLLLYQEGEGIIFWCCLSFIKWKPLTCITYISALNFITRFVLIRVSILGFLLVLIVVSYNFSEKLGQIPWFCIEMKCFNTKILLSNLSIDLLQYSSIKVYCFSIIICIECCM